MKILLWLDDVRNPLEDNWLVFSPIEQPYNLVWLKSYDEFVNWITENKLPSAICWDHDLGLDEVYEGKLSKRALKRFRKNPEYKTGFDCAKWLVEYCLDRNLPMPLYNIQSANSVGKENIDMLLKNYNKQFQS